MPNDLELLHEIIAITRNNILRQRSRSRRCRPCLRTVPIIVIAHTFCASRDTRISYRWRLLMQGYFCAVQNYAEKAELGKCSWYPKRKLEVTTHFSEIIKLQSVDKERHSLLCI